MKKNDTERLTQMLDENIDKSANDMSLYPALEGGANIQVSNDKEEFSKKQKISIGIIAALLFIGLVLFLAFYTLK